MIVIWKEKMSRSREREKERERDEWSTMMGGENEREKRDMRSQGVRREKKKERE